MVTSAMSWSMLSRHKQHAPARCCKLINRFSRCALRTRTESEAAALRYESGAQVNISDLVALRVRVDRSHSRGTTCN